MGRNKILGEESETLTFRLTKKQKESINLLVRAGRYKDKSQFVRYSVQAYLDIQNLEGAKEFAEDLEKRILVAEGEAVDE